MRSRRDNRRSTAARRARAERGASAIELAILAPALLILTMMIIQFALWFQARQAALASAQQGARVAREDTVAKGGNCNNTGAVAETMKYYKGLGTGVLSQPGAQCVAATGANGVPLVGVTMTGRAMGLLSMFGGIPITVTVEGPEECFHPKALNGACSP